MTSERNARQPITVCFVIDELSRAGTETQLLALIRGLDRQRVRPVLCLLKGADQIFLDMIPGDCPTIILGLKRLIGPELFAAAFKLRRFWKTHRVRIVQTYFLDSTYFAVPLARLTGIRRVVRVRNNVGYWLTRTHRALGRVIGRLCIQTLTNSAEGQTVICRGEYLPSKKVRVILNGVDLDRFENRRPPDLSREAVTIGMVGNLRPVKNVDGLIRCLVPVMRDYPNVSLHIAGEGDLRPALELQIAEAGFQNRVFLRGALRDIPAFLAELDVAVLPSHSESLSNALLEYMAAGRAIIATDVGANAQAIRDQQDGLIVPAKDDLALEKAVRRFLNDPVFAEKLSRSARIRVEEEYSRAKMLEEFHRFYESLGETG